MTTERNDTFQCTLCSSATLKLERVLCSECEEAVCPDCSDGEICADCTEDDGDICDCCDDEIDPGDQRACPGCGGIFCDFCFDPVINRCDDCAADDDPDCWDDPDGEDTDGEEQSDA